MLFNNWAVENLELRHEKMVFQFGVISNASSSNKKHFSDVSPACVIATEGKTDEMNAVEDVSGATNYQAPNDNGILLVLMDASKIGDIRKVLNVQIKQKTTSGFDQTSIGVIYDDADTFLTNDGNICFYVSTLDNFLTTDVTFTAELDFLL